MSLQLNSTRNIFIHDFDGVHYLYDDIPQIYEAFKVCARNAALEILKNEGGVKERADVDCAVYNSYAEFGTATYAILKLAEKENLDRALLSTYNRLRHKKMLDWIEKEHSYIMKPCEETTQCFQKLQQLGVSHGLLTAGDYKEWAEPFLEKKDTLKYFEQTCRLDFVEVGYYSKTKNSIPMKVALEKLKAKPEQVVFIEDSLKNFKPVKENYPEILTVLVSNEEDLLGHDDVDMQFSDLKTFLQFASEILSSYQCQHALTHN